MMKKYPKISVVTITYGHEDFIIETIKSVLMQKYLGDIEFIIANDKSPDNTDAVVIDYFQHHPAPSNFDVKYIQHEINKGMMPNFIWALKQVKGEYIALCEGDDYWTDPLKLQKQVDFLEKNDEYSICFHSVIRYDQIKDTTYFKEIENSEEFPESKVLLTNVIHTVSFVFRAKYLTISKLINDKVFGGDRLLVLMMTEVGKLFFMSDNMAVYRIHPGGVSNSDQNKNVVKYNKSFIDQYIYIGDKFENQKNATSIKIVDHAMTIAKYYYNRKNIKALYYIGLAIKYQPSLILKGIRKVFIL